MPQDENCCPSSLSNRLSAPEVSYGPLKHTSTSSSGSGSGKSNNSRAPGRSFGRLLTGAIQDVRLEADRAVAERVQRQEVQTEARRLVDGVKNEIADRLYAKQVEAEEKSGPFDSSVSGSSKGEEGSKGSGADWVLPRKHEIKEEEEAEVGEQENEGADKYCAKPEVAEAKGASSEESQQEEGRGGKAEYEDEDDDYAIRELERVQRDERMAQALVLAEARAQLRQGVVEQFDGDFARFLAGLSDAEAAGPSNVLQAKYVIEKWSRVEMTVNDVSESVCVAVLLPGLVHVEVDTEGHNSVVVHAERREFNEQQDGAAVAALESGGDSASTEYNAEYTFDGAQTCISKKKIEFEYESGTGVLFVFIDQLRLKKAPVPAPAQAQAQAPRSVVSNSEAKGGADVGVPDAKTAGSSESSRGAKGLGSTSSSSSSKGKGESSASSGNSSSSSFLMKVSNKVNSMLRLKF